MGFIPKDEIKRKLVHLMCLIYILGYWYLPKNFVVLGLSIVISVAVFLEILRFKVHSFNNFLKDNFKGFYRQQEADKMSGLVWTLSGGLITILMFPNKYMVFASFLYLVFADAAAALIGKAFGKHKILFGKSLEGSMACFLVCFIIGLFMFNFWFAFIGAIIATFVEAVPWKLNDNFWMQIINAGMLTLLSNVMVWSK
jgi:dolichol kinase